MENQWLAFNQIYRCLVEYSSQWLLTYATYIHVTIYFSERQIGRLLEKLLSLYAWTSLSSGEATRRQAEISWTRC
jgi:hypothetical protein